MDLEERFLKGLRKKNSDVTFFDAVKEGKTVREIAELMRFRDIWTIIKKVKLEADKERRPSEEEDDIKSKSKSTQAIKLFSELKSPVEVAIALDLPANQVRAIYQLVKYKASKRQQQLEL
jgi:hypothetical protein